MCKQCRADYSREKHLLKRYGLTLQDKAKLNGGRCAICGSDGGGKKMHVDHDHQTGEVRGLLCGYCNWVVGYSQESPERLRAAADYLERWQCDHPLRSGN